MIIIVSILVSDTTCNAVIHLIMCFISLQGQNVVPPGRGGSFAQMMNSQASQEHLSSQGAGQTGGVSSQPLTQNLGGLSMTPASQPLSQELSQVSVGMSGEVAL